MKKILVLLVALAMIFALTACEETGNTNSTGETTTQSTGDAVESTQHTTQAVAPHLPFAEAFYGGNAMALTDQGTNGITADRILNRSSYEIFHGYIYDILSTIESKDWEYQFRGVTHIFKQYAVPEDVVYRYVARFFDMDAETKAVLMASERYDSERGIYWIYDNGPWFGYSGEPEIKGYEDLGNGEYILYAQGKELNHLWPCTDCATTNACVVSQFYFKATIKTTEANRYVILDFEYIDSIPGNIAEN